jgi:hypothetical protein
MRCAHVFVVLCTLGAQTSHAEPYTHDGFYLGVTMGLGYYSAKSDYSGATFKGLTAPASSLFIGGAIKPGVMFGGGLIADYSSTWRLEGGDGKTYYPQGAQLIRSLGLFVDYYLDAKRGGFHIQAFVGRGVLDVVGAPDGDTTKGYTVMVGGGYDFWITPSISVGGLLRLSYGSYDCCYDPEVNYATYAPALLGTLTWQ